MKTLIALIVTFLALLILSVGSAQAASIEGGTVIILDTSGSGGGQGVATATDGQGLRDGVLRGLLAASWEDATKKHPVVAVITCSDHPEILLQPTADRKAVEEFARTVRTTASGATLIDSTLALLRTMDGRPANIIYIGDGLLTRPDTSSKSIVTGLPATLTKLHGTAPQLHVIAVDSSGKVFPRTRAEWSVVAGGRIVEVGKPSDVSVAVKATARNLNWISAPVTPNVAPINTSTGRWLWVAVVLVTLLSLAALKLRGDRSRLNAMITIEEDGRTRRTSAATFRKPELSIGDAGCDVEVPKWKEPIRLVQRVVRDRRGRRRQQTIARQGNRSVILGRVAASFSDGKTTVRVRGGRR